MVSRERPDRLIKNQKVVLKITAMHSKMYWGAGRSESGVDGHKFATCLYGHVRRCKLFNGQLNSEVWVNLVHRTGVGASSVQYGTIRGGASMAMRRGAYLCARSNGLDSSIRGPSEH